MSCEVAALSGPFLAVLKPPSSIVPAIFYFVILSFLRSYSTVGTDVCNQRALEIPSVEPPADLTIEGSSPVSDSNGNCTNNLTVQNTITSHPVAHDTAGNTETTDSDATTKQSIVTFDEWTKEKLKQEQLKVASASVPVVILGSGSVPKSEILVNSQSTRNYASKECGAKVITSNPEAENTKALLNDKEKDEYMRNPCSKAEQKFVIIELCETIQPRLIELGNFELFSSGPRHVRIWGTERFPNSDWELVADLNASDTRQLQTFSLHTRVYSKFIKLELVSHYGNEHYCTLSVLKVLGMSMVDEYEIEAQAAVRLPVIQEVIPPEDKVPTPTNDELKDSQSGSLSDNVKQNSIESFVKDELKPISHEISSFNSMNKSNVDSKRRLSAFDIHLCRVCPTSPSCIVPTHLCWVFVWRPHHSSAKKSKQYQVSTPRYVPEDRSVSLRLRRHRFSAMYRSYVEATRGLAARKKSYQNGASNVHISDKVQEAMNLPKVDKIERRGVKQAVQEVPAASISAKESVFLKLNKRIAALELNMSLSSEYLSELSRQYVAQADEHHKHIEQAKKAAHEVAKDVEKRLNQTIVEKVLAMRKEMDSLLATLRVAAFTFAVSPARSQDKYQESFKGSKCEEEQAPRTTELGQYFLSADNDDLWTSEQVVYVVVAVQVISVLTIIPLIVMYINRKSSKIIVENLDQIIQEKLTQTLRELNQAREEKKEIDPEMLLNIREKKRLKRLRQRERMRQSICLHEEKQFSDSTLSRATSQTETSSEAEASKCITSEEHATCNSYGHSVAVYS